MIPYVAYKLIHLFGIFLTVASLGGAAIHAANAGTRQASFTRALVSAGHGIGLFLVLVGGFGMLARLELVSGGLPGWVWAKLVIWVSLGALMILPYRRPQLARAVFLAVPTLGLIAALLALTKPF
jgi:hypothetical protein